MYVPGGKPSGRTHTIPIPFGCMRKCRRLCDLSDDWLGFRGFRPAPYTCSMIPFSAASAISRSSAAAASAFLASASARSCASAAISASSRAFAAA